MKIKLWVICVTTLMAAGCSKAITTISPPSTLVPRHAVIEIHTPTAPHQPSQSYSKPATLEATPTELPAIDLTPLPAPVNYEQPGPLYDTLVQIPVGEQGILYRGAGVPDMQPVGPNGIVVTPDGVIVIGDLYGNRLMRYDLAGNYLGDIDLDALGILNISDLVGIGNSLYILEISFNVLPERYRVNQLTSEGRLVSQYELPKGYHFEDELFGLAVGYSPEGEPRILIQLGNADTSRYYLLPKTPQGLPEKLPALPVFGYELGMLSANQGELAVLSIGAQEFESQMTQGGSIFLVSARVDGSYYLQREDLEAWNPITTDVTIHYVNVDGVVKGLARYPIKDWYFSIWRFLTIGPDGNVYALITREQSVDILRLNFYSHLEPLLSGAAQPVVYNLPAGSSVAPAYDCSKLHRLSPDSTEAGQVVSSVITNYKQDRPTEYLAIEQLWSVDLADDYAIIAGMVTQEETDLLIAQKTDRGYVLVARYIGQFPTPGVRHGDIPGYFALQLPQAPPGLFYCIDLSRFTGDGQ
jgi:hypothetical protein